jgi:hypothetical protein
MEELGRTCVSFSKGMKENGKEVKFLARPANGVSNLIAQLDAARHAAVGRVFAPPSAEKALRAQEQRF